MRAKLLLSLMLSLPLGCQAADFNWSAFGTAGYAISDQPYDYQRFISNQGTFNRDSVFGAQLDVKFSPQWGAAVQGRLAPAANSDAKFEPTLAWAFLSWRPSDDLLVRTGKLRVPFMLNTENQDVGVTYPYARLPVEVYATAPTTDIYGAMFSKTWQASAFEWGLDAYFGKIGYYQRFHGREMTAAGLGEGTWFEPTKLKGGGLVLSVRDDNNHHRIGLHRIETQRKNGEIISEFIFTPLPFPPGEGFYDLAASPQVAKTISPLIVLGSTFALPMGFKVSAEYARVRVTNATNGWDRWAAYGALSRQIGAWTPYAYYSKLSSSGGVLKLYNAIENNRVSPPWPEAINTSQRFAADMLIAHDQSTWALGTAYRVNSNSLMKTEWSFTKTGLVSSFIDASSNGSSADKRINTFSLSYNFTF